MTVQEKGCFSGEHPADELLSAYADGELGPDGMAEVAMHLRTCVACRRRLEEWQRLGQAAQAAVGLKTWPEEVFRRELSDRLTAEARRPQGRLSVGLRLRRVRPKSAAVAAAIMLLLAGAGLGWARSSYDRYVEQEAGYLVREHQAVRLGVMGTAEFATYGGTSGAEYGDATHDSFGGKQ